MSARPEEHDVVNPGDIFASAMEAPPPGDAGKLPPRLPRARVALLADVADLMYYLEWFWKAMHYHVGQSQLERLFGFPIHPGGRWGEQPGDKRRAGIRGTCRTAAGSSGIGLPSDSNANTGRARKRASAYGCPSTST